MFKYKDKNYVVVLITQGQGPRKNVPLFAVINQNRYDLKSIYAYITQNKKIQMNCVFQFCMDMTDWQNLLSVDFT